MNDFDKMKEENSKEFFDIFSSIFQVDKDVKIQLKVTKAQAKEGIVKYFDISTADVCQECGGSNSIGCSECSGKGYMYTHKMLNVSIPPKIKNNDCIILQGNGNHAINKEKRGDLYVYIHIYGDKTNKPGKVIYQ